MNARGLVVVALVAAAGIGTVASQSSLPRLGTTAKDLQAWAVATVYDSTAQDSVWAIDNTANGLTPAATKAIQAMTAAEKMALTQEVLALVKSTVTTSAFRAEHTARIARQTNKAIDHGIDVNTYGSSGNTDEDMVKMTVMPILQMIRTFPADALRQSFEDERAELAETIKAETGEERAKAQKHLARLNQIAPLMKTNMEEFTKQYTLAKSAQLGGPDTEAGLQALTASREDIERIRLEQTFWNKYNLDAILRKNLTKFIDHATKLNLKSPTRVQNGVLYFADGGEMYGLMQLEYLLGQAPTDAAVQFARAWLKELK